MLEGRCWGQQRRKKGKVGEEVGGAIKSDAVRLACAGSCRAKWLRARAESPASILAMPRAVPSLVGKNLYLKQGDFALPCRDLFDTVWRRQ